MSYFISGLPRSRTAWLSVFMSQSGTYYHHDGFNGCHSLEDYKHKVNNCGDSSTGLTLIDLNKEFPLSKVVIIEKTNEEFEACVKWCSQVYGLDSRKELELMRDKQKSMTGLRVQQSDINERLQDIWKFLTDKPWQEKYKFLTSFNIQSNPYNIDIQAAKSLNESIQQNIQRAEHKKSA